VGIRSLIVAAIRRSAVGKGISDCPEQPQRDPASVRFGRFVGIENDRLQGNCRFFVPSAPVSSLASAGKAVIPQFT
jgi:hypothetical protein